MEQKEKKPMPPKVLYLPIGKNEYEVKFPNTGEELDIMIMIQQLSREKYDSLKLSPFVKLNKEALKCEAIAHMVVLVPKLKVDLNVKSLLDLAREQMDTIMTAYTDVLYPWLQEWEDILENPKEGDEAKK